MSLVLGFALVGCAELAEQEDLLGGGNDQANGDGYTSQFQDRGNEDQGDGQNRDQFDSEGNYKDDCYECGGGFNQAQHLRLDLSSAVGLAIVGNAEAKSRKKVAVASDLKGSALNSAAPAVRPADSRLASLSTEGVSSSTRTGLDYATTGADGTDASGSFPAAVPADGTEPPAEDASAEPSDEQQADNGTPDDSQQDPVLLKLDEDGTMKPALTQVAGEESVDGSEDGPKPDEHFGPPMPRVKALGMSPDGSAYVLFEHSFQYRDVPPGETDANVWDAASPYTCQLFRSGVNIDPQSPDFNPAADLKCVTNQHEVPIWQEANRLMQFDRQGRLYFPAMVPGDYKQVFYVYDPVTDELDVKVNGNICWQDVEVTPRGSVFYTGQTSTNGDCGGTGFFRYVSEDNQLSEIARDYWDFKYLAEQNPNNPDSERIVFYGPDPRSTSQDGWNSACLYRYDPGVEERSNRVEPLTDCAGSGWEYVYGRNGYGIDQESSPEEREQFAARCTEEDKVFIGGGYGISELAQMADGTLFVAGDFQRKVAGEVSCDVEINVDHCSNLDPSIVDAQACEAAGADWVQMYPSGCSDPQYNDSFECEVNGHYWEYGQQGGFWYNARSLEACSDREGWNVQWMNCEDPSNNGNFSEQVKGLAFIDPNGDGGVQLLSDEGEQVESFWTINTPLGPEFYYSVYNAGTYSLQRALIVDGEVVRRTVLVDYEVYSVSQDPANNGRILFDGLNFGQNRYEFGSVDPNLSSEQEVAESLQVVEGVTGRIETLVIFPQF